MSVDNSGWDYPAPHILEFTVPASAIDEMGHANNVEYLRWMEMVAWDHSQALGLGWAQYQSLNRGMVARQTELEYLAPAFEGEALQLATWITENDQRISMVRRYQIRRVSDGLTLLRGQTRWVCVAVDSGKPRRMPPEFIESYAITVEPR